MVREKKAPPTMHTVVTNQTIIDASESARERTKRGAVNSRTKLQITLFPSAQILIVRYLQQEKKLS